MTPRSRRPRCGARCRDGHPCRARAVWDKARRVVAKVEWHPGELRQESNTRHLIFDVPRLIEYAPSTYYLYPGDIILTGTPEGVGPASVGDVLEAEIEGIGRITVRVRG